MTVHSSYPSTYVTRGARPTSSSRALRAGAGFLLILYSLMMLGFYKVPYIIVKPGSADNVLGLIRVEEGVDLYDPDGQLLFLTVSLSQQLTLLDALVARFNDEAQLLKEKVVTGDMTREELRRVNLDLMQKSKLTAIKVGLEELGYEVETIGHGALVLDVLPDRPAVGKVKPGDVIVAVDGQRTAFSGDARRLIQDRTPGDRVTLTVRRDGKRRDVRVRTAESDGKPFVGINLGDNVEFDFPIDIDIDTGEVGGPSAGLAFALAVIDELTPGELTGGKSVAITGTIELDGTVGEVGGVEQKAVAARKQGAVLLLVPKSEVEDALPHAGDMKVLGVATIDEAIDALADIGGNGHALARLQRR